MNEKRDATEVCDASSPRRRRWTRWTPAAILISVAAVPLIVTWMQMEEAKRRDELFLAIRSNDAACVEKLLNDGADPNWRESPPAPRTASGFLDRLLTPNSREADRPAPLLAALYRRHVLGPNSVQVTYNPIQSRDRPSALEPWRRRERHGRGAFAARLVCRSVGKYGSSRYTGTRRRVRQSGVFRQHPVSHVGRPGPH